MEDRLDLVRVGVQVGAAGQQRHEGVDDAAAADGGQQVEAPDEAGGRRVECSLLMGLAQGGGPEVRVVGVVATSGEAHLVAVGGQTGRTAGEYHVGAVVVVDGDENAR